MPHGTSRRTGRSGGFFVLDDDAAHAFGDGAPTFTVRATSPAGRVALASLDETRVCLAYMAGDLDVEGPMLELLRLRSVVTDRHPLRALWSKLLHPLLFGQARSDEKWIAEHYDDSPFEPLTVHNDRESYRLTCEHWAENLERNRDEIAGRWGESLFRRFQLYLWGCVDAFTTDTVGAYRWVLRLAE